MKDGSTLRASHALQPGPGKEPSGGCLATQLSPERRDEDPSSGEPRTHRCNQKDPWAHESGGGGTAAPVTHRSTSSRRMTIKEV